MNNLYHVLDEDGLYRMFDVSHDGLEDAIEFAHKVGSEVLRDGERHSVQLTPIERSTTPLYRFDKAAPVAAEAIGVVYSVSGQVAAVAADSPAEKAGLQVPLKLFTNTLENGIRLAVKSRRL